MEYLILVILGLIAGTIGSLVGLGGGVVIVPSLLFLAGIPGMFDQVTPQMAVGTSLLVIIFTGLSSTMAYMKYKTVDYKSGLIFFIGSGPGSIAGAHVSKYFSSDSFSLWFGIFMILISLSLMIKKKLKPADREHTGVIRTFKGDDDGQDYTYSYQPLAGIAIAFFVGFLGGLFGIGGGSLMVPAMMLLFLFPTRVAVATSMFIIFLSSVAGSVGHVISGHVNWLYAFALIPGAWFGGQLGAIMNKKMQTKTIVVIMRLVLILIGIRLIYQGVFS
ncbi:sulfite exporter TauE/SafE family protein [Bacillus swezeyi]|uniref:Probable membrane transporter protein n=1 Tax=Bacillus swezeyi TaxID=1925020 RepID=A0A1R1RZT8_9BACI|nr:sulfite exporter TauE/SafE family protein [Bacillus swezeyi]MEC1259721.1 sulfite exporter TauE/SafE family protein [Bacillus swezeyi]MED1739470.1 sulfite exporter TauE/SafE family protein [Bacillus swezeyi]MED2927316.1 sulfite exporter TauE/SafE family protein [Bacillus swezeyi]MED2941569.1 sulfite exporter TauE/SafE family protein [Bacillus swezeyi]MED2962514.1 sulfite exporter TauE/SafE family protein [Bacillus swezeyi]